jgi:predicted transcriptional regulator
MNTVHREASVLEASRRMRQCHANVLIVVTETDGKPQTVGVVTAGDIVTRVVALGLDPAVLTAGDIAAFRPVASADD